MTRRTWTLREEEALVNALRTIVTTGWKCENGFRCGYLSQLETLMCKQFRNSDLRVEPHINSKIHVWKKYCSSLIGCWVRVVHGMTVSMILLMTDTATGRVRAQLKRKMMVGASDDGLVVAVNTFVKLQIPDWEN
ncbi:UNVERIFIED_CONTAM: hypothetical protein Sangu_2510200 [Sesamum angustifolium]|uniref:Retrotransposon protein n=1 Tax=Sesamum angustifolium TaxID=2727405 RepID=A0AAW2JMJ0_9LAMI